MRVTIYLPATAAVAHELREIRAGTTHSLLCLAGKDGLYLFDRRASSQCCLKWTEIMDLYEQLQDSEERAMIEEKQGA